MKAGDLLPGDLIETEKGRYYLVLSVQAVPSIIKDVSWIRIEWVYFSRDEKLVSYTSNYNPRQEMIVVSRTA